VDFPPNQEGFGNWLHVNILGAHCTLSKASALRDMLDETKDLIATNHIQHIHANIILGVSG
jgi:hypothetical protein